MENCKVNTKRKTYKQKKKQTHNGTTKETISAESQGWNLTEAAKPYRGKVIRLIGEDYAPLQAIEKIKSDFEHVTGIKVEIERYEAEAVLQKSLLTSIRRRGAMISSSKSILIWDDLLRKNRFAL